MEKTPTFKPKPPPWFIRDQQQEERRDQPYSQPPRTREEYFDKYWDDPYDD